MYEIVQVQLKKDNKIIYFDTNNIRVKTGKLCIIEDGRELEFGEVISEPEIILEKEIEEPLRKIVRLAGPEDVRQIEINKKMQKEAMEICGKKVEERKLPMKLVAAEYSFGRTKIIFYFSSEDRVDFRELVKDLAYVLKTRIELRQIGVRDEAKRLGGFGPCGLPLCCVRFLKEFEPVSIRMAKEQNLPLNPMKISGLCGRLMCCLSYEYEFYKQMRKKLPREGATIHTEEGKGKVVASDPLKMTVTIELDGGVQKKINWEEKARKVSMLKFPHFTALSRKKKKE